MKLLVGLACYCRTYVRLRKCSNIMPIKKDSEAGVWDRKLSKELCSPNVARVS